MELSAKNLFEIFEKYKKTVNPFAAVCQCRHETSYKGQPWNSELCKQANNLAGIKQWSGWMGPIYAKESWEQKPGGEKYSKLSNFCKYSDVGIFADNYAKKISMDYPLCSKSADNFWGYFSGLFKGRVGAWATDLAYLDRLIAQVIVLGPSLLGSDWQDKCWTALEFAVKNGRLLPGHEQRIRDGLKKSIPQNGAIFESPKKETKGKLVCLDAGHGVPDPGAVGVGGTKEATVNLQVVRIIKEELEKAGTRVILTREGDKRFESGTDNAAKNRDLQKRPKVANDAGADVFVSIHCNAALNRTARGWEIYTTRGQNNSDKLAEAIYSEWKSIMVGSIRMDKSDGDADKEAGFAVIKGTKCPSCLIELAFISNPSDEAMLKNTEWQRKAGGAIAKGILRSMG